MLFSRGGLFWRLVLSSQAVQQIFGRVRSHALIAIWLLAFLFGASSLTGQIGPPPSFDPDDQQHGAAGIDSINPYNGQLAITIPIGPVYKVGPSLDFQARLHYSSHIWDPGKWPFNQPEPNELLQGDPALGPGWTFSLGKIIELSTGVPLAYVSPDGGAHQLYTSRVSGGTVDGFYYTRDGTYLRIQPLNGSGYKMWTPDGNITSFGQNVAAFDDPPLAYVDDFGRGRNGWHATKIATPQGDAIIVTYQPSFPWVPLKISIPSVNGSGPREITVHMSGSTIGSFSIPTFGNVVATYSLGYLSASFNRPTGFPASRASASLLASITLPNVGFFPKYTFTYGSSSRYGQGALTSQTIPTGAVITYDYNTWTFYHENPRNFCAAVCRYPQTPPPSRPIIVTGPGGEPSLPAIGDCGSPDRAGGVVQRTVSITNADGTGSSSTTKYYQYDFPDGESVECGNPPLAQTETLVVSPPDQEGHIHSTTYLFAASSNVGSTSNSTSGPFVGSLQRTAVFTGDRSGGFGPAVSRALRVVSYCYDTDHYDPNALGVEANRRVIQRATTYNGILPGQPFTGRYEWIDFTFDPNSGHYSKELHADNINVNNSPPSSSFVSRETHTTWTPIISPTTWILNLPTKLELRISPGSTDPSDFSTVSNTFDGNGALVSSTTVDGSDQNAGALTHLTSPDAHGFPSSETFTLGNSTYTKNNLTYLSGTLKTMNWGAFTWKAADNTIDETTGLISQSKDPNGLVTTFTYDVLGRPLVTTPPGNELPTKITYDSATQSTMAVVDLSNKELAWSQTVIDQLGQPLIQRRKIPVNTIVKKTFRYDLQGNKIFESEWVNDSVASPPGTSYGGFDEFGRPTTITTADQSVTQIDYSDSSLCSPACASVWKKAVTVKISGSPSTTTAYSDEFGNIIKVVEPTGDITTYDYNQQDKLVFVTQGGLTGRNRKYVYDGFGFLRSEQYPEKLYNPVMYTVYDPLGNLLSKTEPDGTETTMAYDAAARLTSVVAGNLLYQINCYDGLPNCERTTANYQGGTYPLGRLTRSIGKNPASPTRSAEDITEDFNYSHPAGRLSQKTTSFSAGVIPSLTENWNYTPDGLVANYFHPRASGTPFVVSATYDHQLPVTLQANGLPVVQGISYGPAGNLTSYTTGNNTGHNVTTTIAIDASGIPRPGRISTTGAIPSSSGQNFDTGTYAYDGVGNITAMGSDTFSYDSLSRLTMASLSGLGTQAFAYDRWGNMTQKGTQTYAIDPSNRLSGLGYDDRGNLKSSGSESYSYDFLDRIVTYQNGAKTFNYDFDAAGERVIKIPPTGSWSYTLRDPSNRIATEFVGNLPSRDNVFLGNLLVATFADCTVSGNGPNWTFYSSDHLGTPRLVTDASGTVIDTRKYWPYGEPAVGDPNSPEALRFAGMERDLEGNHYYDHARDHDFALGRFLSLDAFHGSPVQPQSWNRYSYTIGNPILFSDPTGHTFTVSNCAQGNSINDCQDATEPIFGSLPSEAIDFIGIDIGGSGNITLDNISSSDFGERYGIVAKGLAYLIDSSIAFTYTEGPIPEGLDINGPSGFLYHEGWISRLLSRLLSHKSRANTIFLDASKFPTIIADIDNFSASAAFVHELGHAVGSLLPEFQDFVDRVSLHYTTLQVYNDNMDHHEGYATTFENLYRRELGYSYKNLRGFYQRPGDYLFPNSFRFPGGYVKAFP